MVMRRPKERLGGGGKWCPNSGVISGELQGSSAAPVGRVEGGKGEACQRMQRRGRWQALTVNGG
jgi:hypothetical protein